MTVLVIADLANNQLQNATLHTISAAKKLGDVHVLVASADPSEAAQKVSQVEGVSKVLSVKSDLYANGVAEEFSNLIKNLTDYTHYILSSTSFGKNLAPRLAALFDCAQISDVISVENEKTFKHPIYAGNVIETVEAQLDKVVLTIRSTAFDAASSGGQASVEEVAAGDSFGKTKFVSVEIQKSERPELTTANVVVSGGRGLGDKENFEKHIFALADKLNAAIGASRAAVDAGYIPNDFQVGQTGKVVAPQLYIAVGISGAIQHIAGMQDSKVIVAINKDPDAPIFNIADFGLVADLNDAVPELISKL